MCVYASVSPCLLAASLHNLLGWIWWLLLARPTRKAPPCNCLYSLMQPALSTAHPANWIMAAWLQFKHLKADFFPRVRGPCCCSPHINSLLVASRSSLKVFSAEFKFQYIPTNGDFISKRFRFCFTSQLFSVNFTI